MPVLRGSPKWATEQSKPSPAAPLPQTVQEVSS
jgi:hypothetical protein